MTAATHVNDAGEACLDRLIRTGLERDALLDPLVEAPRGGVGPMKSRPVKSWLTALLVSTVA